MGVGESREVMQSPRWEKKKHGGVPGPGAQVLKEAQRRISKVKQANKKSRGQFPDSPKGLLRLVLAL